jgi:hypothetical protein
VAAVFCLIGVDEGGLGGLFLLRVVACGLLTGSKVLMKGSNGAVDCAKSVAGSRTVELLDLQRKQRVTPRRGEKGLPHAQHGNGFGHPAGGRPAGRNDDGC